MHLSKLKNNQEFALLTSNLIVFELQSYMIVRTANNRGNRYLEDNFIVKKTKKSYEQMRS